MHIVGCDIWIRCPISWCSSLCSTGFIERSMNRTILSFSLLMLKRPLQKHRLHFTLMIWEWHCWTHTHTHIYQIHTFINSCKLSSSLIFWTCCSICDLNMPTCVQTLTQTHLCWACQVAERIKCKRIELCDLVRLWVHFLSNNHQLLDKRGPQFHFLSESILVCCQIQWDSHFKAH